MCEAASAKAALFDVPAYYLHLNSLKPDFHLSYKPVGCFPRVLTAETDSAT